MFSKSAMTEWYEIGRLALFSSFFLGGIIFSPREKASEHQHDYGISWIIEETAFLAAFHIHQHKKMIG